MSTTHHQKAAFKQNAALKVTLNYLSSLDIDDLDEMVMDMAYLSVNTEINSTSDINEQERLLSEVENTASDVNNCGKEAQINFLVNNGYRAMLYAS
ncbi:hypothetical protein HNW13_017585 [Shewanella sp. BF02_Schw]|uniref:hypothetical protein n=1 Tax=Shewanella sp. BF02_Schw TaxID=394908 RepID=UPI0017832332|nr:hypothetical protein [Shewanella sp. BF02_Schw]MBO1897552.1 hypothetical protein [Shewanella sp. BF02_Schw]